MASFYNVLDTQTTPPTFNRTNRFTQGFQNLIASYAFSSYRELNPGLYLFREINGIIHPVVKVVKDVSFTFNISNTII